MHSKLKTRKKPNETDWTDFAGVLSKKSDAVMKTAIEKNRIEWKERENSKAKRMKTEKH